MAQYGGDEQVGPVRAGGAHGRPVLGHGGTAPPRDGERAPFAEVLRRGERQPGVGRDRRGAGPAQHADVMAAAP